MRALGIDFGHKRIGVSISDPQRIFASPLAVFPGCKNPVLSAQKLAKNLLSVLAEKKYEVDTIVVGLPLHLNGSESTRSGEVKAFGNALQSEFGIKVVFIDERLTSVQAERLMKEANLSRKKRTQFVDTISSTIILQSFLDQMD